MDSIKDFIITHLVPDDLEHSHIILEVRNFRSITTYDFRKPGFQTVVLEKTLESPLDSKIKPVNPKGNQP